MEHFQIEENKSSSNDEEVLGKNLNVLLIDANSFEIATLCCFEWRTKHFLLVLEWIISNQCFNLYYHRFEDIAVVGMTIPEEIIDKIFQYERYIFMKEHSIMYKYVL